jgi:hypothetical protein
MTLKTLPTPTPTTSVDTAELNFSSSGAPSAKLTLNINAFNGNKTNFGGRGNK